jgi:hypothetical protein
MYEMAVAGKATSGMSGSVAKNEAIGRCRPDARQSTFALLWLVGSKCGATTGSGPMVVASVLMA